MLIVLLAEAFHQVGWDVKSVIVLADPLNLFGGIMPVVGSLEEFILYVAIERDRSPSHPEVTLDAAHPYGGGQMPISQGRN